MQTLFSVKSFVFLFWHTNISTAGIGAFDILSGILRLRELEVTALPKSVSLKTILNKNETNTRKYIQKIRCECRNG